MSFIMRLFFCNQQIAAVVLWGTRTLPTGKRLQCLRFGKEIIRKPGTPGSFSRGKNPEAIEQSNAHLFGHVRSLTHHLILKIRREPILRHGSTLLRTPPCERSGGITVISVG